MLTTNKLRVWELSLMVGVAVAILWGLWVGGEQTQLANHVIRLHVIANSDTQEDQALKLLVRDTILASADALLPLGSTVSEAQHLLADQLPALSQLGAQVVAEQGYDYPVTATLRSDVSFPTKEYDDFALPAGDYTALQLTIGDGGGENWWCVVFPPLCLGSVSQPAAVLADTDAFTVQEVALITGESEGYVLKFKSMELWDGFKKWVES